MILLGVFRRPAADAVTHIAVRTLYGADPIPMAKSTEHPANIPPEAMSDVLRTLLPNDSVILQCLI